MEPAGVLLASDEPQPLEINAVMLTQAVAARLQARVAVRLERFRFMMKALHEMRGSEE